MKTAGWLASCRDFAKAMGWMDTVIEALMDGWMDWIGLHSDDGRKIPQAWMAALFRQTK